MTGIGCKHKPLVLLDQTEFLLRSEKVDECIELIRSNLALLGTTPAYCIRAGQIAFQCDAHETALELFERAAAANTNTNVAKQWKAICLFLKDQNDQEALGIFETLGFIDSPIYLAALAEKTEQCWLKGMLFRNREIHKSPDFKPMGNFKLSRCVENGNWQPVFDSFNTSEHKDDESILTLAVACEMLGGYSQSLEFLDLLSDTTSNTDFARACRGKVLVRLHRFSEATAILQNITIQGPEDFGLCYYWGVITLAYDLPQKAKVFFRRAFSEYHLDTMLNILPQLKREILSRKQNPS